MAHVVTDEKFAAGAVGGFQDTVAAFDGDRHGFFQIDSFTGFEGGDSHFFVEIVGGGDVDGADGVDLEQITVIGESLSFGEFFLEVVKGFLADVASGDDFNSLFGTVHLKAVDAPSAGGDQTYLQFFHGGYPFVDTLMQK